MREHCSDVAAVNSTVDVVRYLAEAGASIEAVDVRSHKSLLRLC